MSQSNTLFPPDTIVISKETVKRLSKDIKELIKNPLDDEGIYYKHDDTNILKGYAYISGPSDSVYVGGNYFFTFNFPYDYPHKPPKVEFHTNDGVTRFHPNMYRSGKICLSILNTWRGDQWTGCQSIRTILLTILSIMDSKPILHEPGFTESHDDFTKYNEIILYKNFDFCINKLMTFNPIWCREPFNVLFKENMISEFNKKRDRLLAILTERKNLVSTTVKTTIYSLSVNINWNDTYLAFTQIKI